MKLYFGEHFTHTIILLLVIALLVSIELFCAKRKNITVYDSDQTLANVWIFFINANVAFALQSLILFAALNYFYLHGLHLFTHLSNVSYWLLLFVMQDFIYYWQHRFVHECRWGWASHVVHHSATKMNFTVTFREGITSLVGLAWVLWIPLTFLGFKTIHVVVMEAFLLLSQTWCHTELIGKLGWWDKFFNSPANHRVHHGSNERYLDKNYGGAFIIWDRLFGTYMPETEPVIFGITTGFNSNNLVKIYFHGWWEMFAAAIKQKSLKALVVMPKFKDLPL